MFLVVVMRCKVLEKVASAVKIASPDGRGILLSACFSRLAKDRADSGNSLQINIKNPFVHLMEIVIFVTLLKSQITTTWIYTNTREKRY
jgi:hypothetical protein